MNVVVTSVFGFKTYKEFWKMANRDDGDPKVEVSTVIENNSQPASEQDTEELSQSYESPQQSQAIPEEEGTASDDDLYDRDYKKEPGSLVKIHRLIKTENISLDELKKYLKLRQFVIDRQKALTS